MPSAINLESRVHCAIFITINNALLLLLAPFYVNRNSSTNLACDKVEEKARVYLYLIRHSKTVDNHDVNVNCLACRPVVFCLDNTPTIKFYVIHIVTLDKHKHFLVFTVIALSKESNLFIILTVYTDSSPSLPKTLQQW